MTARQKADRFFKKLNAKPNSDFVGVTQARTTVCFQLKDGAPWDDLAKPIIKSDKTGQTMRVYDDNGRDYIETAVFCIDGAPSSPNGRVRLGIGQRNPIAVVVTHQNGTPKSVPEILDALVAEFNSIYQSLGWTASQNDGEVKIPDVPCEEGAIGGTDDEGLEYSLSLLDSGMEPYPHSVDRTDILASQLLEIVERLERLETRFLDRQLDQQRPVGSPQESLSGSTSARRVRGLRYDFIRDLVERIRVEIPNDSRAIAAAARLEETLSSSEITNEDMEHAREIRRWFFE
jgi:hypothetical protein